VYDFLSVINNNLGPLAALLRYSEKLAKNRKFCLPPLI